jgi:hypothetical protein
LERPEEKHVQVGQGPTKSGRLGHPDVMGFDNIEQSRRNYQAIAGCTVDHVRQCACGSRDNTLSGIARLHSRSTAARPRPRQSSYEEDGTHCALK